MSDQSKNITQGPIVKMRFVICETGFIDFVGKLKKNIKVINLHSNFIKASPLCWSMMYVLNYLDITCRKSKPKSCCHGNVLPHMWLTGTESRYLNIMAFARVSFCHLHQGVQRLNMVTMDIAIVLHCNLNRCEVQPSDVTLGSQ